MRPICYLHVGTHKTGTTSVQNILASNDGALADAGIYVPRAGRSGVGSGHHNIAWQLNDDPRFDPLLGTFNDLLFEIAKSGAPRVCLSSEDFEYLHERPLSLAVLANGLHGIGYDAIVVVYLRPQASYAESLYAELVKHGLTLPFDAFLQSAVATGEFRHTERWCFAFDYERLLDDFAAVFGVDNIIARRYDAGRGVVADFLNVIGAAAPDLRRRLVAPARLNPGLPYGRVLQLLEGNRRGAAQPPDAAGELAPSGRFDPVHLREVQLIVGRFKAGNRRIREKYGVAVPCVAPGDLIRDLTAAAGLDPASRRRRDLISAGGTDVERTGPQKISRPAIIEASLAVTAAAGAGVALSYGSQAGCTALVEFGMLATILAASAAALLVRYTAEVYAVIADDGFFSWGARLSAFGYFAVGLYALVNAALDVGVPRYEPDWFSYPGTIAAAIATIVLTILLPAHRRLLGQLSLHLRPDERGNDRFFVACCYIMLLLLAVHAFAPVWWLDTTTDIFVAALAAVKLYQIGPAGVRARGLGQSGFN